MTTSIYGLDDPETQQLRYIGKTARGLEVRLRQHLRDCRPSHRVNWIQSLRARGLMPGIFEIESVSDEQADGAERFWIAYFKYIGADLTNGTDGGEGGSPTPEVRARLSSANLGKTHSAEVRAKISSTSRGRKKSEDTRAKLSSAQRGKKLSAQTRDKISASLRGKTLSAQTRAKLSAANRGRKHTPETRAKISTANLGMKRTPEARARMSAAQRNVSPETRALMGAAQRGWRHTPETRAKMSAAQRARRQAVILSGRKELRQCFMVSQ